MGRLSWITSLGPTRAFIRERKEAGEVQRSEDTVKVVCGGEGHKPRGAGGLWTLQKAGNGFSPECSEGTGLLGLASGPLGMGR